jgi:4-carboxymuconolactone decarboxylase
MKRIAELDPAAMTSAQAEVYTEIASGPRGGVRGPLAVWLHRPALANCAQALGRYCRYDTCLPARLSELAIVVTGALWKSAYEWEAHAPLASNAGIAQPILDAIRHGRQPVFDKRDEKIVHDFIKQLHEQRQVSDASYAEAVEVLGQDAVVDLIGLAGYYTLISMTINVFGVESKQPVSFGGEAT